jgi:FAD/FMN-containing dehydrogenase
MALPIGDNTRMSPLDPQLQALRSALGPRWMEDRERLRRYEIPERGEPGHALCALIPEREAEVGELLSACSAAGLAIVVSAGRTGLVEAQRPDGEGVLSLEKINRPLELTLGDGRRFEFAGSGTPESWRDALHAWWLGTHHGPADKPTLTAEAGMSVDVANFLLEPLGLMWPMELASSSSATVGACVANASAGSNAVRYGTAAQMCQSAWGFWADGSPAGPHAAAQALPADPAAPLIDSALVRPEWGLVGSQGVLGVITRVQLHTYPVPTQREAVLLPLPAMQRAIPLLEAAREAFPGAVEEFEFIGLPAVELVQRHLGVAFRWPFESPPDAPFYILLQVKSEAPGDELAARLYDFLAAVLDWPAEAIGYAPLPILKKLRHSITEASNARMRQLGGGRLSFDTATPLHLFGEYLEAFEREVKAIQPQIECIAFGHAGVGGAHLHLLGTREQPVSGPGARHKEALIECVLEVTRRYHGTYSAEHGVGPKWAAEFQRHAPAAQREALLAAKRLRDPAGILSPRSFGLVRPPELRS